MAFTDAQATDIRRYCGYPAYGAGPAGFQGWRFFTAYGLLEFRIANLSAAEEAVVTNYLVSLASLEQAVTDASGNLGTAQASVWTRNAAELRERTALFDDWRRRLCGFLGVPAGPALGESGVQLVV
jgi:hypothetical protein